MKLRHGVKFCNLVLSTSAPRVFSLYIMQIGKRPVCSSVCVFGAGVGMVVVLRVFLRCRIARAEKDCWGTSCFHFILISEVELLFTFFNSRPLMCIR